jgi:hypothetical protein
MQCALHPNYMLERTRMLNVPARDIEMPMRRDRLVNIANLLAAYERATPLARRVLECRLCLIESQLISAPQDQTSA